MKPTWNEEKKLSVGWRPRAVEITAIATDTETSPEAIAARNHLCTFQNDIRWNFNTNCILKNYRLCINARIIFQVQYRLTITCFHGQGRPRAWRSMLTRWRVAWDHFPSLTKICSTRQNMFSTNLHRYCTGKYWLNFYFLTLPVFHAYDLFQHGNKHNLDFRFNRERIE